MEEVKDLIHRASGELLVSYEQKNGVSIPKRLTQYEQENKRTVRWRRVLRWSASATLLVAFPVMGMLFISIPSPHFGILVGISLFSVLVFGVLNIRAGEICYKAFNASLDSLNVLEIFAYNARRLDPFRTTGAITAESVRTALLLLAREVASTKDTLRQLIRTYGENAPTNSIVSLGQKELDAKARFEDTLSAAEEFGLAFKTEELFRASEKLVKS